MRKLLTLSAAAAALFVVAVTAPADAAVRKTDGVQNGQTIQMDLSARRYYRRYYRHYRYYPGPYYRPYGYYYGPGPYYYGPRYYYRPVFPFPFFPFF
jgi:hypothetical protein